MSHLKRNLSRSAVIGSSIFVLLLLSSPMLRAQVTNGVNGVITDSSGAAIANAHVTITNISTGVGSDTNTSSTGLFTVVGLLPGEYSVVVGAPNFATAKSQVVVEVARMSTLNISLRPGRVSETVQVNTEQLTLNTTSPEIGATLEPELVSTAPIEIQGMARQIDSFSYLAPGVQGTATSHAINGGVTFENEVQFNGVPVAFVQFQGNQTSINPPYEAIDEFRVASSTFNAQYGIGQGAVTFNMASGTNRLHGDAFEILRNQLFDSAGFFPTRFDSSGKPEAPINQQNDFGFTVGGPVIIPKLYNGRNRTFFHVSTDWFRQNQAQNNVGTVPTAAMKQGDFSNFVDSSGNLIPIYDPQTGQPFPDNKIPSGRFSPLSQSLLASIPDPDTSGINSGLVSNKLPAIHSIPIRQTLWAYTIDENITRSQSIHFSQWHDGTNSPFFTSAPIVPTANQLQSGVTSQNTGTGLLLNYSYSITPNLVVTAGVDSIGLIIGQHNANNNVNFGAVSGGTTMPLTTFDGQNAPTTWGVSGNAYLECCEGGLTVNNNRTRGNVFVNNWLWSKGRHSLNMGFQYRRTYQDVINCNFCSGTFNFSQRTTSTPDSTNPNFGTYGSSFASFLLGLADATERNFATEAKLRNRAYGFYVQDDFKMNDRLTINAGIRYDILVPFTEAHNNISFVNRTGVNPGATGIPGAVQKFGSGCDGCSGITRADIHWKNWQPRVGFSYQINKKTVVQSGFYLTFLNGGAYEYGTAFAASFMANLQNGSFIRSSTGNSTPGYGNWDSQQVPYPAQVPFTPAIGNAAVVFDFPYKEDNKFPELPNSRSVGISPYDQAWNVSVQRELPWNMFMTVSYVGNRAIHLPATLELSNQPNPSVLQYGPLLALNILDPAVVAAGFTPPYPEYVQQFGSAAILEQALTPFPQFAGFFPSYEMDGTAFYNAFQVQGEKRFTGGASFLANYTYARLTSNTAIGSAPFSPNGMNAYNPRPEWGPSYIEQPYSFKFVGTYALPFGHGHKYANQGGIVSALAGGWQISAILNYAGGFPFGAQNSFNPLLVNSFDRPDIVSSVPLKTFSYNRSKDYFTGQTPVQPVQFTTNAFQNTGPWELGTAERAYRDLRTPPLRLESFNVIKSFHIWESLQASVRLDYFNAFNRTQFQEPDNNSLDSTFGQITNLTSQISNRQGQATFRVDF
jgi:Carboxypeptidase regulatory-like domain/TonB dependent receptor